MMCGETRKGARTFALRRSRFGLSKYGFILATGFAALLCLGSLLDWAMDSTRWLLKELDRSGPQVDRSASQSAV